MRTCIFCAASLLLFACNKHNPHEKAVRDQMRKMNGAAAYADLAQVQIFEVPAKDVYQSLADKSKKMIEMAPNCNTPDCQFEIHRLTEKMKHYQQLGKQAPNKTFYKGWVVALNGGDTLVSSYLYFDDKDQYIDFLPRLAK